MKTCSQCQSEKPLADFYKKKGGRLGVRGQCKVCVDEKNRTRYFTVLKKDPEFVAKNRARNLDWYRENRERNAERVARSHREQRQKCLDHYGPNCACCGESTYEFLSIDHIEGGGTQHRKTGVSKICRWLIQNGFPPGFRVLCHNCNQAIGFHGVCPHQRIKEKASGMRAASPA